MNISTKQNLKIQLHSDAQFQQARDAFIELGYHWGGNGTVPHTAPYLYSYSDGSILADYFDVEGADLSSPKSAFGYFTAHDHQEISLDALIAISIRHKIWIKAPTEAFHWERFPNGRCVWHCRIDAKNFTKKAPNFEIEINSLWRDINKQREADQTNASINSQLSKLNIVLA